ncbi:hypothetical protein EVAR_19457_1 [Eumeta japonica]|uniref:Uncharacterized protein n=1 Tax=Eumeta variegata TaxID=151549 RepID=A0A4C1VAC4_EUMVA|nr:hypothetical protein EVAR_19457_1 [Eumeta japonica]
MGLSGTSPDNASTLLRQRSQYSCEGAKVSVGVLPAALKERGAFSSGRGGPWIYRGNPLSLSPYNVVELTRRVAIHAECTARIPPLK